MFYNKEVKLYELKSVKDKWGITREEKYTLLKTLLVDIQPYSQEKLKKDYGYDLRATKRMFCDLDNTIEESTLITYRGMPYSIVKIVEWDDYLDISLNDAAGVDVVE